MKRILLAVAALLTAVPALAQNAYTPVSATAIKYGGAVIPSGSVTITLLDSTNNTAASFVTADGTLNGPQGFAATITNGAISSFNVPDMCTATNVVPNHPLSASVQITKILSSSSSTGYSFTIPAGSTAMCGSSGFALDHYTPAQTAPISPTGLVSVSTAPTHCGSPNLTYLNVSPYTLYEGIAGACVPLSGSGGGSATTDASQLTSGILPVARLAGIPNSALANSSITFNGTPVALGGSVTFSAGSGGGASFPSGTGLVKVTNGTPSVASAGTDYATPASVTAVATAASVASNLTSGTVPVARLAGIPNSALANASITINGTPVSLGGSTTVSGGSAAASQWSGKNIGYWGDSITTPDYHGDVWRNIVNTQLGATQSFLDARVGRPLATMFDNYTAASVASSSTINIFNGSAITEGVVISATNGNTIGGFTGYSSSDFMDLRGAPSVVATFTIAGCPGCSNAGYAFYDANKTFVSGAVPAGSGLSPGTVLTVPAGVKYLRVWTADGSYTPSTAMVVTGSTVPGSYQAYDATTQYSSSGSNVASGPLTDGSGHTLAQNLAGVNLLSVWLGTNDGADALGTSSDAAGAATFYGYMQYAAQQLHAANPSMRVVWITPYQYNTAAYSGSGAATPTQLAGFVTAMKYVAGLYGDQVIDLLHESGINSYNWATLLVDGVHPNYNTTSVTLIGPMIANRLNRVF